MQQKGIVISDRIRAKDVTNAHWILGTSSEMLRPDGAMSNRLGILLSFINASESCIKY